MFLLCDFFCLCHSPTKHNTHCVHWRAISHLLLTSVWACSFICVEDESVPFYSSATYIFCKSQVTFENSQKTDFNFYRSGWKKPCVKKTKDRLCLTCVCEEVLEEVCPISRRLTGGPLWLDYFHPGDTCKQKLQYASEGNIFLLLDINLTAIITNYFTG